MKCVCCPFECRVDRSSKLGVCGAPASLKVAKIMPHFWEEPCISGVRGSGAVFFAHCHGSCLFCQNYRISQFDTGEIFEDKAFISCCEKLVETAKVHNINLVTPTHYSAQLLRILPFLRKEVTVPIIWNSNGYEKDSLIEKLNGLIDIFLPDLKYFSNSLAAKFSGLPDYFHYASRAIKVMQKNAGEPAFDDAGIMQKGLIIRHLVLPGQVEDSKKILVWIAEELGTETYLSLMSQYYPAHRAKEAPEINRCLYPEEYQEIQSYCLALGFENGFFQDLESNSENYTPEF